MSPDKDIILKGLCAHVVRVPNGEERSQFRLLLSTLPHSLISAFDHEDVATHLAETIPKAVLLDQFKNPENAVSHELTTGPELIECIESTVGGARPTSGKIDAFFAGCGTGGTVAGVSKAIKKKHNPDVKIIACDPVSLSSRPSPVASSFLA